MSFKFLDLKPFLICVVCNNVLNDPLACFVCHRFSCCKKCGESCKECDSKLEESPNLKNKIQDTRIDCTYCGKEMIYREWDEHAKICIVECTQKCGQKVKRTEQQKHIVEQCPNTIVNCIGSDLDCNVKVERSKIEEHEKTCKKSLFFNQFLDLKKENETMKSQIKSLEQKIEMKEKEYNKKLKRVEKDRLNKIKAISEVYYFSISKKWNNLVNFFYF